MGVVRVVTMICERCGERSTGAGVQRSTGAGVLEQEQDVAKVPEQEYRSRSRTLQKYWEMRKMCESGDVVSGVSSTGLNCSLPVIRHSKGACEGFNG